MPYTDDSPLPKNYWAGFSRSYPQEADFIRAKLQQQGVLQGLPKKKQDGLVDRVLMISRHYKFRTQIGPNEKRFNVWRKRGPAQLRRLRANFENLNKAFENLRAHAASIGASGNVFLVQLLDDDFQLTRRLEEIGAALGALQVPPDTAIRLPGMVSNTVSDPKVSATRVLAEFLTATCGLSGKEAEVRIAKIGTTLWKWKANFREHYEGEDRWKGSDAIRKRLKRDPARRS